MTKLTSKQEEFISFLSNEFIKLNQVETDKSFNVVNINTINNDLNVVSLATKELKLHNEGMLALHNNNMEKVVELLNDDFKKADFPIVAVLLKLSDGFCIEIEYDDLKNFNSSDIYYYKIKMDVKRVNEKIEYGLHTIGYKVKCYEFVEKWDAKEGFASPQLFFADTQIQKRLVDLVKVSKNVKSTGRMK